MVTSWTINYFTEGRERKNNFLIYRLEMKHASLKKNFLRNKELMTSKTL